MGRLRLPALLLASSLALGGCAYGYGDYGYGGVSAGYGHGGYCDPYFDDCYGDYDPWYGWYDGYYYPGWGYYIYDSYRRPYRWGDRHRRYWETRRHYWGNRDWNDRRWERWDGWEWRDGRNWRGGRNWRDRRGDNAPWREHRRRGDWGERSGSQGATGVRQEGGSRLRTRGPIMTDDAGAGSPVRGERHGRDEDARHPE